VAAESDESDDNKTRDPDYIHGQTPFISSRSPGVSAGMTWMRGAINAARSVYTCIRRKYFYFIGSRFVAADIWTL